MTLKELSILNFKNIREADLHFSDKLNCLVGLNGQGKTNILDAIYHLSFTKSAFCALDNLSITHGENMCMVQGLYANEEVNEDVQVSCAMRRGLKKQFRWGKKDYKRMLDHIGRIPLVMLSPEDSMLIQEGSDERRRFVDGVIAQCNHNYLEQLTHYNVLLKQRNTLLKQLADDDASDPAMLEIYEQQMLPAANYIYEARTNFVEAFVPFFQQVYHAICGGNERVELNYVSQLQDRNLQEAFVRTRQRDIILGWTSQGVHKDDILMLISPSSSSSSSSSEVTYPLKQIGSQGQQKTYCIAMKLAQALYLAEQKTKQSESTDIKSKCILLLDDIFDKLDAERVERIVELVQSNRFGQIFITDTDRQHLTKLLKNVEDAAIFHVENGVIH